MVDLVLCVPRRWLFELYPSCGEQLVPPVHVLCDQRQDDTLRIQIGRSLAEPDEGSLASRVDAASALIESEF